MWNKNTDVLVNRHRDSDAFDTLIRSIFEIINSGTLKFQFWQGPRAPDDAPPSPPPRGAPNRHSQQLQECGTEPIWDMMSSVLGIMSQCGWGSHGSGLCGGRGVGGAYRPFLSNQSGGWNPRDRALPDSLFRCLTACFHLLHIPQSCAALSRRKLRYC